MSGGVPTSGGSPPPPAGSPPRTLFIVLAACMFLISFGVLLLVTAFLLCCRWRRDRSSALPGNRCGGDHFPVETALPAFSYVVPEDGEGEQGDSARECAVCLAVVKEGEMVRQLPACSHLYHVVCIDSWLAAHRTCPVCRSQLYSFEVGVGSSTGGLGAGRCTHPPDQSPV